MKKYFSILAILLFSISIFAQNKYTISGYIQDASSGENLIGVSVYEKDNFKGTTTNTYGFYSLTLPEGNYTLAYSFIGLKEKMSTKGVFLQTEIEFNKVKYLPDEDYRFIRLGFAAMDEEEVVEGLSIVMKTLFGESN